MRLEASQRLAWQMKWFWQIRSLLTPTTRSCHKGCRRRGRQQRKSLRVTISQKRKLELKKQQRQKLVWIQNTADRRGGGELVLFHVIKPDRRERTCRGRQRCLSSPRRDLNTSFCEGDEGPCGPCVIVEAPRPPRNRRRAGILTPLFCCELTDRMMNQFTSMSANINPVSFCFPT